MKTKLLLTAMFSLALTLGLAITGCENGTIDAALGNIDAPKVTVQTVDGGIVLAWSPIINAHGYEVYRKNDAGIDVLSASFDNSDADSTTGKIYYGDLVRDDNPLTVGTARTYTVSARSASSTLGNSQTTVKATPTAVSPKGTKLPAPSNVLLELDADKRTAKVSWTPGSDNIAISYRVRIYCDGSEVGSESFPPNVATIDWNYQPAGAYTARVTARWSGGYYTDSDTVASLAVQYDPLFGNSDLSASLFSPITDATNTITGYIAQISFSGKPGVAYTVARATADALGNTTGAYTPVTLSKGTAANAPAVSAADLTADFLGNMPVSYVYDRTLPETAGYYKYQVTATKGAASQKKERLVGVDPHDYISGQISVASKVTNGSNSEFSVTPSLYYKNALQTGDQFVLYYVSSSSNQNIYQTGPYTATASITFTKAELEAATIQSKKITVPAANTYVFVQAYIEFANGTRENVPSSGWNYSGGISTISGYYNTSGDYIYYARLNNN
jgi:hypothetical protein